MVRIKHMNRTTCRVPNCSAHRQSQCGSQSQRIPPVDPEQRSRKEIRHDGRADEHGLNRRLTFEDTQAMNNHHQHRSHYSGYPLEDPRNRGERVSRTQNMQAQNDANSTCADLQAMRHHQQKRRPDFHGRDFTARHQRVESHPPGHDPIAHQTARSTNRNDDGNYTMKNNKQRVSKEALKPEVGVA